MENEYTKALEKEVKEMRKFQKLTEALLDLYSYKRPDNVFHKDSGAEVTGQEAFVLKQMFRVVKNLKKMDALYEASLPVQDTCGVPEPDLKKASPLFKRRAK